MELIHNNNVEIIRNTWQIFLNIVKMTIKQINIFRISQAFQTIAEVTSDDYRYIVQIDQMSRKRQGLEAKT